MTKKNDLNGVITLLIITLITLATWVGTEVYGAYVKRQIPEGVERHFRELDPNLDTEVITSLKNMR